MNVIAKPYIPGATYFLGLRMKVRWPLIALTLAFGLTVASFGQVTSNVLKRTFLISHGNETATGFTIEVDSRQYLITAKHFVAAIPDGGQDFVRLREETGWWPIHVTILKCSDPSDIAVLVPDKQLSVTYPLNPDSTGLTVGEETYFVGYPLGQFEHYPGGSGIYGLVKRGTVSALESDEKSKDRKIVLDAYNVPGFSGSPVVFGDPAKGYKVAAVISGFIFEAGTIVKKKEEIPRDRLTAADLSSNDVIEKDGRFYRTEDTEQLVKLNTGIALTWDIGSAVDLIRMHPIGPKINADFSDNDMRH